MLFRSRMAYWVDRERYPESFGMGAKTLATEGEFAESRAEVILKRSLAESDSRAASEALAHSLEETLQAALARAAAADADRGGPGVKAVGSKGIFSPITNLFTKILLADVNDFLFNKVKRDRMVQTVKARMETGGGPFVVIGHSQGSMVTYQALMELGGTFPVELFVTLGSPLGLPQVRSELKKWHGNDLPIPPGVKRWINVARDGDIVCADQTLADEYRTAGKTPVDYRIGRFAFPPAKAHEVRDYLDRKSVV